MHPLFASSEYTVPFWLPTNRRPLATVGCDHADVASGNPNAHFSESRDTWSAVMPACCADWNRVLLLVGDQPIQAGEEVGFGSGGIDAQRPTAAPVTSVPNVLPLKYSATARRSM